MGYLKSTLATVFLLHIIFQIVQGLELPNVSPRTCIIGAGYSGLATARHLKTYNMDFTVFEASEYLGGVWHFDSRVGVGEDGIPIFSKTYTNLRMDSPYQFTEFHDFPFPNGTSSYLSWDCMHKYLWSFATKFELLQHIQFRRLVTSVKRFVNQWQLTYWRGDTRETVSETCDYVVIATGTFNEPVWPDIQGAETFQGTISHSHTYRGNTERYRSRRVLIVGAGLSGLDLATQISRVASKLIHSHHRVINLPVHAESYVKKPDIKSFTHNGVIFNDGSFEEVDDVIYCTGYSRWHPFLDDSSGLIRTSQLTLPLYRKMVNIKHPSMLFIGAVRNFIQKVFDIQGNYAASLIAGRFQLPSEDEMMKNWIEEINRITNVEDFHTLNVNIIEYYCGNMSQEAGIPTLPPVFITMLKFAQNNAIYDYSNKRDYDWRIIDDHTFDRVYVGPKELTCPIETNTPYQHTEFHDFPFPEGISTYPSWECIHKYLSSLATKFGFIQQIQLRRLVTSVKRLEDRWQLTYWKGDTRDTVSETCDYVVIATGRFNDPVWPEIQGADTFQGTISHSYTYRGDTEMYRSRRVLIVGAGTTGLDLVTQISRFASKLIHSHHRIMNLPVHEESYVKKPDIRSFTHNGVIFNDGSFEEVDDVIYCTGYSMWHAFLDDSSDLIRTRKLILPLYRKIVNIKHPTMLFVGAIQNFIHRIHDIQGNYAASLIAGQFQLPSEDEMMKTWIKEIDHIPNVEDFHTLSVNIMEYYCGNMSQEAGISTLPPVFITMLKFAQYNTIYDFSNLRDYDWRVIDDHNFDRVYVGPKELTCPIE